MVRIKIQSEEGIEGQSTGHQISGESRGHVNTERLLCPKPEEDPLEQQRFQTLAVELGAEQDQMRLRLQGKAGEPLLQCIFSLPSKFEAYTKHTEDKVRLSGKTREEKAHDV